MKSLVRFIVFCAISLIVLESSVFAQVPSFGVCPRVTVAVADDFDVVRYMGRWYEQDKYPFIIQFGGKCATATYALRDDGIVSVLNRQIDRFNETENIANGTAILESPGKLIVNFAPVPIPGQPSNYWILDTDYDSYAVVFSCVQIVPGFIYTTNAWVLTRARNPPQTLLRTAYDVFDRNNISSSFLLRTDQLNCDDV
ncbi:hypothetical protein HA402_005962 [Bradysia odoriphaga]|nr:hypothetical protein HA402_005962 [Bradysia odoriphaga]